MKRKITAIMMFVVIMSLFSACGSKSKKVFAGKYDGKKIYSVTNHPESIMESIEETIIDLDSFKTRENQKYLETIKEAKQIALFNRQIIGKLDDVKREYLKIIPYNYMIQHIFHTDRKVAEKLMLEYEKLKTFEGFSEMAKEHSLETATKTGKVFLMR